MKIRSLVLIAGCLWSGPHLVHADIVTFPDPNLEAAVRQAIPKPDGDITTEDMAALSTLDLGGCGILDTTGLETAVNLTELNCSGNPVTHYAGISGLASLRRLVFDFGSISDIAFLAPLRQLEELEIYSNQIADISPLAGLWRLTYLQLDWNPVTDHTVLAGLTNLTTLSLAGNGLTQLSFVGTLPRLRSLGLYINQVRDLSPLVGCTNLTSLGLGWNGVTNPTVLATLTGLENLHLNGNALTNVPYITGLTNLTGLSLDYTELDDLSPVTNLTRLVWLNIGENHLTSLPDLSPLVTLQIFMLAGNPIADLSPVADLPELRELHIQRGAFSSIAPLAGRPLLQRLLLSGNPQLADLTEVTALTNLTDLELRSMHLAAVDFLPPLAELRWLDLGDNWLTDCSALTNLPWLDSIGLEANRLTIIDPLLDLPSAHNFNVRNNYLDTNATSAAWAVITNLQARGDNVEYDPQRELPPMPNLLTQPANRSAYPGETVAFTVTIADNGSWPEFRWQKNGVDLENGGNISGADGPTLEIADLAGTDAGLYCVRVFRDWVTATSSAAELRVVTNVVFADANLEQAVRAALGIFTGPLTPDDLAGLTHLYASHIYWEIRDLDGLETAANLEELDLNGQFTLTSLAPLRFLSRLTVLNLNFCGLDSLEFLGGLHPLSRLDVSCNFIQELAPVRAQPGLQSLNLDANHLTDIAPLLELAELTETYLQRNHLDTNAATAAWNVITHLIADGVFVEYDPQFTPMVPPAITLQPVNVAAYPNDHVEFHVEAAGSGSGLNYRWQKTGINLADSPRMSGTDWDTLWIDDLQPEDAGDYRVRVWDEFGVAYSRTVTLRVVTNVAFVDPNLELAVRDGLGIPSGPISLAQIADMYWLEAVNRGITNLSGLDAAGNLDWLSLGWNPDIADYSPLALLPNLGELHLTACNLTNLDFLASLAPLRALSLDENPIADLSVLAAHSQLAFLNLSHDRGITDFTVLYSLTNLDELHAGNCRLTDLAFVERMPRMARLEIWDSDVEDISAVAGLSNLWLLNLHNTPVTELTPLAGLTNLTVLAIGWTGVTEFTPVTSLIHLSALHVGNLGLTNLAFLAPLTNLVQFIANENHLTGLPPYPHLSLLRHLDLSGNPLAGVGFVAGMTNLWDLHVNRAGVRDLSPLTGLTNLHNLGLAGNGLTNLEALASLPSLTWVTLWENHLQDITPLAGLSNLDYVDLRRNWLDLTPGSAAMTVITTLQGRGTSVDYDPQDTPVDQITLSDPQWLGGGQFTFSVTSAPGAVLQVWRSADLGDWTFAGFVTNLTGTATFTDTDAPVSRNFYRASLFPLRPAP
jgi:internalin A